MSQVLYRFWSNDDELLYVGITARPWERWKQHRGEKPWWEEVAKVTIENFATRAEVKAAETIAIKTENPLYNIAEKPSRQEDVEVAEPWDGKHVPQIACVGDYLYCTCSPPDWEQIPAMPYPYPVSTQAGDGTYEIGREYRWRHDGPAVADEEVKAVEEDVSAWYASVLMSPEDYADHVIESVATERWAEAMAAARAGVKGEERQRKRSAKFVLEVWPESLHQYLPRQYQSYVRGWLDAGLTRDDVREALMVALEAKHVPMERAWKYAAGVLARMQRELNEAAEAHLENGGA